MADIKMFRIQKMNGCHNFIYFVSPYLGISNYTSSHY